MGNGLISQSLNTHNTDYVTTLSRTKSCKVIQFNQHQPKTMLKPFYIFSSYVMISYECADIWHLGLWKLLPFIDNRLSFWYIPLNNVPYYVICIPLYVRLFPGDVNQYFPSILFGHLVKIYRQNVKALLMISSQ